MNVIFLESNHIYSKKSKLMLSINLDKMHFHEELFAIVIKKEIFILLWKEIAD
jgi:hypothetical protein